ncbi:hypothetical protein LWC34_43420 [Kibdelosporangium philippinense]|uniref:HEAT repeat domain-containing protein n=1 Tax=Kibdelosporangium philippinense TaxID=211113 RepID=A0ABS8ZPF2_9PSEU|nr:hypothetical protein [Kibdelosporangium philippinense]MCE7009614.1 hypothetical protein [Kibdelosporangium philippinense]
MSTSPSDQELWDAFVGTKREMHRRQAEFYQQATDKTAILRTALSPAAGAWHQGTALDFLSSFNHDTTSLLPELMPLAMSHRWLRAAQDAIAHVPLDRLLPVLEPLFLTELAAAEDDDYWYLASLAARLQAWSLLEQVVRQAEESSNPEVRESAQYFVATYGPMWTAGPTPADPIP